MSEPEYLTPDEVAEILRVHKNTVLRRFANMPGVIDIGTKETMYKRRRRVLRIPRAVLKRYTIDKQVA